MIDDTDSDRYDHMPKYISQGMMCKKVLSVCIAAVAYLVYLLYIPYPEECDYPIGNKIFFTCCKAFGLLGEFLEKFGFSYWTVFRLMKFQPRQSLPGITLRIEMLGGIKVAFIEPEGHMEKAPGSAMIHFHGGGWTMGSIASHSLLLMHWAKSLDMLIIVPEYRLAPEYPFPLPFEDCLHVTEEFMGRAAEYNVDPKKIVLSGDSAGGNLAITIVLELRNREQKSQEVCMLNMLYPTLQFGNLQLPSFQQNINPPLLPPHEMVRYLLIYMNLENHTELIEPMLENAHMRGFKDKDVLMRMSEKWIPMEYKQRPNLRKNIGKYSKKQEESLEKYKKKFHELVQDIRFSPLTASDPLMKSLPTTNIVTCEFDILRDEGIILHERMKSLGMPVTLQHLEFGAHGLMHGYGVITYDKLDKEMDRMFDTIRNAVMKC